MHILAMKRCGTPEREQFCGPAAEKLVRSKVGHCLCSATGAHVARLVERHMQSVTKQHAIARRWISSVGGRSNCRVNNFASFTFSSAAASSVDRRIAYWISECGSTKAAPFLKFFRFLTDSV